jgi:serine/threonine-protein kinase HipA
MQLQYDKTWVQSRLGRPLSLSLPFSLENQSHKGEKVLNYFDNLLPDSDSIRKRIAARFKTASVDPFDLLMAIGRDCVGAVQLLGVDEEPTGFEHVQSTPLSSAQIEQRLNEASAGAGFAVAKADDADFRISLAGAQEKTAFLWWDGQWRQPHGATPTTHIFKMPMGLVGGLNADFSTSVDNEWLCLRLLKAYGLPVAEAEIHTFGAQRVLVVERFDRRVHPNGQWIMRLPQEDFCQVEGVSPLQKYESDGGPGLQALFKTLRQSENAPQDMRTVMAAQLIFWLLGAPDGHAKNFSVHILPGGRFQLTKLYDVMSAYPVMGDGPNLWSPFEIKMAMALLGKNRHYPMHNILRRHFNSSARKVGYADNAEPIIEDVLQRTHAAIEEVNANLPQGFNQKVAETILGGVRDAATQLAGMPAT